MLGGDKAEQTALLCPEKGTEGDNGTGRKALKQSRDKEQKKRHKKAGYGARKTPSGPLWKASHAPGLPSAPAALGPLKAKRTAPRPSRSPPPLLQGPHKERAGGAKPPTRPLPGSSEEEADAGAAGDEGSSAALAAPGPGRFFTCFSASPLLLLRSRRRVGVLQQQEARLRGDSAPSLNVAPVLGDVDAAAASCRHRCNRCPTSADRGHRA